jgi:hemin uptake protein HemP
VSSHYRHHLTGDGGLWFDFEDENNYRFWMDQRRAPPPQHSKEEPGWTTSQALLGARRELVILHNGREYHLRLTQNGKLILTA